MIPSRQTQRLFRPERCAQSQPASRSSALSSAIRHASLSAPLVLAGTRHASLSAPVAARSYFRSQFAIRFESQLDRVDGGREGLRSVTFTQKKFAFDKDSIH